MLYMFEEIVSISKAIESRGKDGQVNWLLDTN
jgi:hypothetical protein